ncbi:hypothetical protein EUGRSUZ_E02804, partial [Eucalyptus grandis]
MESEIYEAAVKGNVHSLRQLLGKDKLLLDRIMIGNHTETPLHIAAMLGHLEFLEEVLARKAELAREQDSQRSTPLHLAAAKGYLNIVTNLLRVNPEICFVRDKYERNPLHVAAMKGHVDVLEFLVRARPDAAHSVIEHGQTILHLCVKHNRFEALKLLMDILGDDQFINLRDEYGNTILHLAASDRQTKTIVFLLQKGVNPNITNSRGLTALGLLAQGESTGRTSEIKNSLPRTLENHEPSKRLVYANNTVTTLHSPIAEENKREQKRKWQNSMHKTLMVVATLLATMAFQTSITPPGGLWQEDFPGEKDVKAHTAGESIMADKYPSHYKSFVICNTLSFIASLSIIMLLVSGLPLRQRRITTWIAMLTMWIAITFMAATYAISFYVFTPPEELKTFDEAIGCAVLAWLGLMALLFLWHVVRLIRKL